MVSCAERYPGREMTPREQITKYSFEVATLQGSAACAGTKVMKEVTWHKEGCVGSGC
jgi:hypothetical protein